MPLSEYRRKRDPKKTPEPFGSKKRGKQPSSRTFTRHEAMSTTGDLVKDARVTVYYRDERGKSVAHKVVVKAGPETAAN